MPNFGTVDFSGLWSVVAAFVTVMGPLIAISIGLSLAYLAVSSISRLADGDLGSGDGLEADDLDSPVEYLSRLDDYVMGDSFAEPAGGVSSVSQGASGVRNKRINSDDPFDDSGWSHPSGGLGAGWNDPSVKRVK